MKKVHINNSGSAIVISLLIMMVLIVLSVAVNSLLLRDIHSQRDYLAGIKALYMAEAGVEHGLLMKSLGEVFTANVIEVPSSGDESALSYGVVIRDMDSSIPCEFETQTEDGYGRLRAGESVIIPLNTHFKVSYYIENDDPSSLGILTDVVLNDSLRWKIFGRDADDQLRVIGDYIPIWDYAHNTSAVPSQFGADENISMVGFTTGKYYDTLEGGMTADDLYTLDLFAGANQYVFHADYPIAQFLDDNTQEFLVLTHVLNLLTADEGLYNANDYSLYYKIEPSEDDKGLTCPSMQIMADGMYGNYKKSLNVTKKLYENSPFTQFVWYQR